MLEKKYRLPVGSFFNGNKKPSNQTIRNPYFLLKIYPTPKSHSRFGVVISKKIDKRATARNKIKRAIFYFFGIYGKKIDIGDYLCITLSPIKTLSRDQIINKLKEIIPSS